MALNGHDSGVCVCVCKRRQGEKAGSWGWGLSCLCGWLKVRGTPDYTEGPVNHYSMALLPAFPEEDLEDAIRVYSVRVRTMYAIVFLATCASLRIVWSRRGT